MKFQPLMPYTNLELLKLFNQKTLIGQTCNYDDIQMIRRYKKLSNKSEKDLQKEEENTDISRWPIFAFLLSAVACLLSSSIFHCFYCISPAVYKVLIRLDYAGICFLISGSTYAPYFYGFYCNKMYAIIYSGFSCMSCFIVFIISL